MSDISVSWAMTGSEVRASQESHNVKIWHTVILHTLSGTISNLYIKNNRDVGVLVVLPDENYWKLSVNHPG